jgi:hypothetical protein
MNKNRVSLGANIVHIKGLVNENWEKLSSGSDQRITSNIYYNQLQFLAKR